MYRTFILGIFITLTTISHAQLTLSYDKNIPLSGDSSVYHGFDFLSPGDAGNGVSWDFSALQQNGVNNIVHVPYAPQQNLNGPALFNLLMEDNGFEYYLQQSDDMLIELATTKGEMSMIYTDPLVRMKFPFSFGEQFSDAFVGTAIFPDRPEYLISGNMTVTADGYGNLVLPSMMLDSVLRIKQVKNINEQRPCSFCRTRTESYKWYAPGYRYPVVSMSTVIYQIDNQNPVTLTSAFLNLNQSIPLPAANPSTGISGNPDDSFDPSLSLYPNPFHDRIQYVYFLKKKATVSLSIADVYGNTLRNVIELSGQKEGMYSGEIDLEPLTLAPGMYFLRFVIDNKVITRKMVKI